MMAARQSAEDIKDLTSRARIRNVALTHFAERGFKATTIRGVADDAGVSPSSVQHHFGTKDGLREACDAYVMDQLRGGVERGLDAEEIGDPEFLEQLARTSPPILRYLGRALAEGTPTAGRLFDQIVALTEDHLDRGTPGPASADPRAEASVLTAMKLGVIVLYDHLSRALGVDAFSPTGLARINQATLQVISPAVTGRELTDKATAAVAERLAILGVDDQPHGDARTTGES